MKKFFFAFLTIGLVAAGIVSCGNPVTNDPDDPGKDTTGIVPPDTIPTNDSIIASVPETLVEASEFPMMHLLEHFTGEACGYCPIGYMALWEFTEKHPNVIWVSHHKGFADDQYTIKASSSIVTVNGVSGAPSCAIDRAALKCKGGSSTATKPALHPVYLSESEGYGLKNELAETTNMSVLIDNAYNKYTRELTVHVFGYVADPAVTTLKLSVLVKESGMVGEQHDYNFTFEGWEQYRHVHVPRAFLTASLGDQIDVVNQKYDTTYTIALKDSWIESNMSVVAYATNTKNKPVMQAAVKPVVAGTEGGAHMKPEGLVRVPVSESYPESGKAPSAYGLDNPIAFPSAITAYYHYTDVNMRLVQAQATSTVKVNGVTCVPFLYAYFFVDPSDTKFPTEGVFPINLTQEPGTFFAGFRDDEQFLVDGSQFYLCNASYLQQNYIVPEDQWLLTSGEMKISDGIAIITSKSRAGDDIVISFSTKNIQDYGLQQNAPAQNRFDFRSAGNCKVCNAEMPLNVKPQYILF